MAGETTKVKGLVRVVDSQGECVILMPTEQHWRYLKEWTPDRESIWDYTHYPVRGVSALKMNGKRERTEWWLAVAYDGGPERMLFHGSCHNRRMANRVLEPLIRLFGGDASERHDDGWWWECGKAFYRAGLSE